MEPARNGAQHQHGSDAAGGAAGHGTDEGHPYGLLAAAAAQAATQHLPLARPNAPTRDPVQPSPTATRTIRIYATEQSNVEPATPTATAAGNFARGCKFTSTIVARRDAIHITAAETGTGESDERRQCRW